MESVLTFLARTKNLRLFLSKKYQLPYEFIGKGAFGKVIRVRNYDEKNGFLAIKVSEPSHRKDLEQEYSALQKVYEDCDTKHVVCFRDYFDDSKEDGYGFLATEFLEGYEELKIYLQKQQLKYVLKNLNISYFLKDVPKIINQIITGIRAIHRKRLAHRDIKPTNILIHPETLDIKIIDFGASCDEDNCKITKVAYGGTPEYYSPEIWYEIFQSHVFGFPDLGFRQKGDLWAIGLVCLNIINLNSNHFKDIENNLKEAKIENKELFEIGKITSKDLRDKTKVDGIGKLIQEIKDLSIQNNTNYFYRIDPEKKKIFVQNGIKECFFECIEKLMLIDPDKREDNFIFQRKDCIEREREGREDLYE